MLTRSPSRQNFLHRFKLNKTLTPLTIGIAVLTALGIAMETKPSLAQSQHYNGRIYRRTISIPRRIRSTNSYPDSGSPYYHDRHNRVRNHDHHSNSPYYHDHHNRVRNHDHYSNSPYYHDHHNRVRNHDHHSNSPYYHDHHNRVRNHDNPYSNSPYYHDRYNRVRRKFPHSPRYNRRRRGGSRIIFDSPGLRIRLGR